MLGAIIRAITALLIIYVLFVYQYNMYFYIYELTRRVLDFVHSNLQHKCLNNIELIMFFSKKIYQFNLLIMPIQTSKNILKILLLDY